jgi:hypothetical protein
MSLEIIIPRKKYVCIANDKTDKEIFAYIDGNFRPGEIYEIEGSMSGIYWYIYDKEGAYKAVVREEYIKKNFVSVKSNGRVSPLKNEISQSTSYGFDKYVCISNCQTEPKFELWYTLLSKHFIKGRTYNIKINSQSPLLRYIYEDGPYLENYIACVDKSFVDENFVSRNQKEYIIYEEVEKLFDKYFLNE